MYESRAQDTGLGWTEELGTHQRVDGIEVDEAEQEMRAQGHKQRRNIRCPGTEPGPPLAGCGSPEETPVKAPEKGQANSRKITGRDPVREVK